MIENIAFTNEKPLSKEEALERERAIYDRLVLPPASRPEPLCLERIRERGVCLLEDRMYNRPQNIFFLNRGGEPCIVGRKLLSQLNRENKIGAVNCSRITASMLLGLFAGEEIAGGGVRVAFHPFSDGERAEAFSLLKGDRRCDICHPYCHLDYVSGEEMQSPPEGWRLQRQKIPVLGWGEEHIRRYTREYFRHVIRGGEVVYDPACSTGQFLREFKEAFPGVVTIGHDLSREMVEYAKDYVDFAACCDAGKSPLPAESVDILFLRFLNSEVVRRAEARRLFDVLAEKVKPGGWAVCFGHTPVLIESAYFAARGMALLDRNGYDAPSDSVFQYYVMRKAR